MSPLAYPAGLIFHLPLCPKNRQGLSWKTSTHSRSSCPRRRYSSIVSVSMLGLRFAPVAGAVDADHLRAELFEDVAAALRA